MPNHVTNILTFQGDPEIIHSVLEAVKSDEDGYGSLDFDKIIPMPVDLNIESGSRTDAGLHAYNEFVKVYSFGRDPENLDFLNIPKESEESFLRMRNDIDRKTWNLGRQAFQNIQKYGHPTWYEWHIDNWGTKWNAYNPIYDDGKLEFQTAWSAPSPIIQKLAEIMPEVQITHEWADEDIGVNCGRQIYENGELTEDWVPSGNKEAVEFAAEILDVDPSDYGLVLNATGSEYIYCSSTEDEAIGGIQL